MNQIQSSTNYSNYQFRNECNYLNLYDTIIKDDGDNMAKITLPSEVSENTKLSVIRLMLQCIHKQRGASIENILDYLGTYEVYPFKNSIHVRLCQYVDKGWLEKDERVRCKACGSIYRIYHLTQLGQIKLRNYGEHYV